jgi:two-component system phosphate regulon sensor histidine kinase PhoR
MTICIVAINAFQGYWLWTTYQLNRQQFSQNVQDALFQVLEGQQVAEAGRLFGKKTGLPGNEKRVIIRRYDSQGGGNVRFSYNEARDTVTHQRKATLTDTLARRISSILVKGWQEGDQINLKNIKNAYRAELARRFIKSDFALDTLRIIPRKARENVMIFDSRDHGPKTDGLVKTLPLPVNPVRHLFVQASFATPVPYLLRRMGWLLGASVLLLCLTTSCFLFMLNTILKQKRLSEIKNDFINNMTHELKTPISTVTAAIEALLHFGALKDPAKTQDYLTISQNNMQRLSDLVEKVLNLAVEEKQELELCPEPVNLSDLVEALVADHRVRAVKPVNFKLDIPEAATVSVDKVHFGNVLNNLIDNAINYSEEQVVVRMNYRKEPDGWQLAVADNGIGIPKAYHAAIFDRFFRVPTGNLHVVKGFGLGLAYVRQVVERHGGSIRVTSEPGKGSEFILKF